MSNDGWKEEERLDGWIDVDVKGEGISREGLVAFQQERLRCALAMGWSRDAM